MSTTICFDFGNTRLKAGVFTDSAFREEVVLSGPETNAILPLLEKEHPDKIILSSATGTIFAVPLAKPCQ
jgi:type III pantothenate kinase